MAKGVLSSGEEEEEEKIKARPSGNHSRLPNGTPKGHRKLGVVFGVIKKRSFSPSPLEVFPCGRTRFRKSPYANPEEDLPLLSKP
ncbi:hypothetical protein ZHAS_00008177 [Anopheles sinensis]|uniref:Uncharacterized protein n=1 Tax=Anopheles sinensis TaxID=74873 RepID=A0A084VS06_ANOSI|nr:hypothetical protein ZHAS_00008177 [Anopheles sinensis]